MGIWRSLHALAAGKNDKRTATKRRTADSRFLRRKSLAMEPLEERALLAIGLLEIEADHGAPIVPGQVREVAVRELVFRFDVGQTVDPNSVFGISIVRSGDGILGNGNDIAVDPLRSLTGAFPNGFVG